MVDIVWQPLIQAQLESGANPDFLRRAFAFVEELCQSNDAEVRYVAAEVSWRQLGATPLLDRARPYFGECTQALVANCEAERLATHREREPS